MGEDPKTIMAAANAAEAQRQQQEAQRQAEAAKRRAATVTAAAGASGQSGASGAVSERAVSAEKADRWTTEMLPTSLTEGGRKQQGAPLNAAGKADTSTGGFLHVPGAKRSYSTRRRKAESGADEADESYIEIPDSKFQTWNPIDIIGPFQ